MPQRRNLHELNKLNLLSLVVPAGTSSAARLSMLLDPPNRLRRAAVALAVGVGIAELKLVPLVELTEEAEGGTEGRAALPTCSHTHTYTYAHSLSHQMCQQWQKCHSVIGTLNAMSMCVEWDHLICSKWIIRGGRKGGRGLVWLSIDSVQGCKVDRIGRSHKVLCI